MEDFIKVLIFASILFVIRLFILNISWDLFAVPVLKLNPLSYGELLGLSLLLPGAAYTGGK